MWNPRVSLHDLTRFPCFPQRPFEFPSVREHPNLCVQVRMAMRKHWAKGGTLCRISLGSYSLHMYSWELYTQTHSSYTDTLIIKIKMLLN